MLHSLDTCPECECFVSKHTRASLGLDHSILAPPQNGGGWAHLSHTPVGKSVITVVMIVKLVTVMLPVI